MGQVTLLPVLSIPTVNDVEPPVITCPADITVITIRVREANVTVPAPAFTDGWRHDELLPNRAIFRTSSMPGLILGQGPGWETWDAGCTPSRKWVRFQQSRPKAVLRVSRSRRGPWPEDPWPDLSQPEILPCGALGNVTYSSFIPPQAMPPLYTNIQKSGSRRYNGVLLINYKFDGSDVPYQ